MATIKQDLTLKLLTQLDGDVEEISFSSGSAVEVLQEWARHYLIKDDDGHFFNVKKEFIDT